nr:MAG TPA: hypothetical protein [Caudoviricetes sp.]
MRVYPIPPRMGAGYVQIMVVGKHIFKWGKKWR